MVVMFDVAVDDDKKTYPTINENLLDTQKPKGGRIFVGGRSH